MNKDEVYKSVKEIVAKYGLNLKGLREILAFTDGFIEENKEKFNTELIDCKSGCGYCCVVNISVLGIEAENIAEYLTSDFHNDIMNLKQKLREKYLLARGLTDEERIAAKIECIFLDDCKNCMIYPVRPILCRSVTSTDHNKCIEAVTMSVMDEDIKIISNIYIKEIYETVYIALADVLKEKGKDCKSYRLLDIMCKLLN
ncbi:YkgJ family cysteine cluster protein [Deferribacter abyssi]|uniref:YkgJ family cysteine cluster protein n=1 Tax=Deferribacter abyssi TaxID=213806 RepID=UPI003C2300FF